MSRSQLALLRQVLGAGKASSTLPLGRVRDNFDKLFSRFPALNAVEVTRIDLDGVPCERVDARTEPEGESDALIVHLHGGGFVLGSPTSHRNLAGRLSRAADAVVIVPDYRRAPEHPFPAQIEDALAVWRALPATERTILSGDSAGGGLAVQTAVRLASRDASRETQAPEALVCFCPWVDYAATTPSLDLNGHLDPLVDRFGLELMASQYLGGRDPWDPEITALRADLSGLPRTLIQTGGDDTLLDDAKRLAQRFREHGVEVELDVWDGMTHIWHLFAGRLDEGAAAIEAAGAWLRAPLGR